MSLVDTLLTDIESAVRGTGERRRHALLRRTTAMMIDQIADLSDRHLSIFDDVLLSLAYEVEIETRAELSEKLADLHRVPKKTCRALALDDAIRVAKPLIEKSPCLDDETLMAIVTKGDHKILSLVARRRGLPTQIMDYLVERADDVLLIDIAGNDSTPISDRALRILAEHALSNTSLYRIVRTRSDLAMRHVGAMIEAARYRAKADAITRDASDDMLSRALAIETARKIAHVSDVSLSSSSIGTTEMMHAHANLDSLLAQDRMDDALAILAVQSGLSPSSIKRVFHAPQFEPLMFILRAQDYPIVTLMNFLRQKHGEISPEFELQVSNAYCEIARDTAKRIASFMMEKATEPDMIEPEALRRSA